MTLGPCATKSSCSARMNFSLSLFRLPVGRPFGLPDWPGCQAGEDGFGRGILVQVEQSLGVKALRRFPLTRRVCLFRRHVRSCSFNAIAGLIQVGKVVGTDGLKP